MDSSPFGTPPPPTTGQPGPPPPTFAAVAPSFAANPPSFASGTGQPLPSIAGWSKAAKISVGAVMIGLIVDAFLAFQYIGAIRDLQARTIGLDEAIVIEDRLVNFALILAVAELIAAGCVITWLYRAAKNAEKINPARMNNTPKWAIWGWLIPFMNLVRPYHMVKETWEASRRDDPTATPKTLLGTWWGLWLASNFAIRILFNTSDNGLDNIATTMQLALIGTAMAIVAGALFIRIIGMIEKRQLNATAYSTPQPSPMPHYVLPEADQIVT